MSRRPEAHLGILLGSHARTAERAPMEHGRLYPALTVFMTLLVVLGFWQPYFGPILRGDGSRPWLIHLHGIVFSGWMALLTAQVVLVSKGRIRQHRMLGNFGVLYGALVVIVGVIVAIYAPVLHVRNGDWDMNRAVRFMLISLRTITVFGGFFAAATAYRRKPEIHKRLILLATVALLFAPAGRLVQVGSFLFLVVWLSPLLVALARDIFALRRVDPSFVVGLLVLMVGFTPIVISESDRYLKFGEMLLRAFM